MELLTCLVFALVGCGRTDPPPATQPAPPQPLAVAPAPRPTGPLPANATCVTAECHARYQTAARIHGPVSAKSCQSCHQPDAGGHTYPLARAGNATCTFCHNVAGNKAHQHKAVEQQGCTTCHDPHAARAKYLLTADNTEQLCRKCHDVPLKKHAHEPFANGQCTLCHQAHESQYAKLLRTGEGPEHCYGCHSEKKQAITKLPHVHKASAQTCVSCHGPHATDFARQLKASVNDTCLGCHTKLKTDLATAKNVHGAVTTGCTTCHDAHAAAQPAELRARMDKLCLTCHDKPLKDKNGHTVASMKAVLASKNLHGPVKSGNCSDCHQPHAGNEPNLLRKHYPDKFYASFDLKNYALCFSCHEKQLVLKDKTTTLTNFRDGSRNLHFVHVNRSEKGRTCKTCHEVHGSDLPKHMAASVPFEGSSWAMPIRYEASSAGGTCTPGCHGEMSYNRERKTDTAAAERGR